MSDTTRINKEVIKSFRLTHDDLARIEEQCRLRGVRFSEFVRTAAIEAVTPINNRPTQWIVSAARRR